MDNRKANQTKPAYTSPYMDHGTALAEVPWMTGSLNHPCGRRPVAPLPLLTRKATKRHLLPCGLGSGLVKKFCDDATPTPLGQDQPETSRMFRVLG